MSRRTLARYFAGVALLMPPGATFAGCLSYPAQGTAQTISFGTVGVTPDTALGTVLAERTTLGASTARFKCVLPARTSTLGLFPRPSSLGNGIYETNVPGVGIRISFDYGGFGHVVIPGNAKVNVGETYVGNARVQLIKTGRITAGGTLQSGNLGQAGYEGRRQAWVDLLDARVEVKRRTCAFLSKRVELNLGKVDGGVLAASGESHWATNQLVSTGCDGVTEMHLTFSGTPDDSNPHWFKLTGGGAATGVAIEFRSDHLGTPIVPNDPKPLVLRAWPEGRAYGFRARYRTTSKPLRPGSGNTHITVNVLYI